MKIPVVQKALGLWRPFPSFVFCGAIRFFLMAAAAALGVLGLSRVAQADIHITSIAPACADLGDPVVITGNGFGALNVTIRVSGVVAQVVSATGNRVTVLVPPSVPAGVTRVTATNPGGQTESIAFRIKGPEICNNEAIMRLMKTVTLRSMTLTSAPPSINPLSRTPEPIRRRQSAPWFMWLVQHSGRLHM